MYTQMFPLSLMNHMEYNFPKLMDCLHLIVTEGVSHTDWCKLHQFRRLLSVANTGVCRGLWLSQGLLPPHLIPLTP